MARKWCAAVLALALLLGAAWSAKAESAVYAPVKYLALGDVRELAALGDALTSGDLGAFYYDEQANGDRAYALEEGMTLVIGAGGKDEPVQYARLFKHGLGTEDERLCVDIRTGDIDAYLAADTAGPLVETYLKSMQCPGACTYVVAIINIYPKTRSDLLALDYRALPTLSAILRRNEHGIPSDMAEVFVDEILSRRVTSSYVTEETLAIEAEASDALIAYTGNPYKPHAPNPSWAQ